MFVTRCRMFVIAGIVLAGRISAAVAGGGGQNMLLLVNPYDENALRIATAYQQIRGIPDSNIVFQGPLVTDRGFTGIFATYAQYQTLLNTVQNAIDSRDLENQIDYIATLGLQSTRIIDGSTTTSSTHLLMNLSQITGGLVTGPSQTIQSNPLAQVGNLALNANAAIHHDQVYPIPALGGSPFQYYMAGTVANTGQFGSDANRVIEQLYDTAGGDGTKPQGTIYFEENDDVRSNTREGQWPSVKAALDVRGIPWVQSRNTPGSTPLNRSDVRGAVVGKAVFTLPNGSTYLPGSWADSLTSSAAKFSDHAQSKATQFLDAGAGGSSGTVTEPFAFAARFPHAAIHVFNADGSTLGEAFFKSVERPELQLFIGDLLAQPYADVPDVVISNGPAEGATVSGHSLQINATASLSNSTLAAGIKQVELWIDGKLHDTLAAADAQFNLDTTALSDGRHELRLVAINNAAAESQGYVSRTITVNNQGRSVQIATGNVVVEGSQSVALNVEADAGHSGATIQRIELRNLGRVVGSLHASSGSITLFPGSAATLMAYGDNAVVPVAIYSDGREVAGDPMTLTRNPVHQRGDAPTPQASRTPGIKAEYFLGQGSTSIAASDFTGPADIETNFAKLMVTNGGSIRLDSLMEQPSAHHPTTQVDHLAVRYSGRFEVGPGSRGEYAFTSWAANDSIQLKVDGELVLNYDNVGVDLNGGSLFDVIRSIFLDEGEHDFELLLANVVNPADSAENLNRMDVALYMRGPDSVTRLMDSSFVYQAVPEPAACLCLGAGWLLAGRPRRRQCPGTGSCESRMDLKRGSIRRSQGIRSAGRCPGAGRGRRGRRRARHG